MKIIIDMFKVTIFLSTALLSSHCPSLPSLQVPLLLHHLLTQQVPLGHQDRQLGHHQAQQEGGVGQIPLHLQIVYQRRGRRIQTCAHSMAAQARERDRETRVEREVRQERGEEGRPYSQPVKCAVQGVTNKFNGLRRLVQLNRQQKF